MDHVLGKITGDFEATGGPDAVLDIVVDRSWLQEARTIEVDLPRNLACAACEGTGCNICNQSGAITVRERSEPPEVLRVTLPRQELGSESDPESQRVILMRIYGRGGLPSSGVWPSQRGRLLLRVKAFGTLSDCVRAIPEDQVVSSSTLARADVVIPAKGPESTVPSKTPAEHVKPAQFPINQPQATASVEEQSPATRRSRALDNSDQRVLGHVLSVNLAVPQPTKISRRHWGGWRLRDALIGLLLLLLGAAAAWLLV